MGHPADGALPAWLRDTDYAHRGLHGPGRPENSLPAFDAAAAAGLGIELDVRVTADGVPVVVHDDDLGALAGARLRVTSSELRDLEGLRLAGGEEPIPTLARALGVIEGRVPVMVEVKSASPTAGRPEVAVARALAAYAGPATVASFNPVTVAWFARHGPEMPRGQIAGRLDDVPIPSTVKSALRRFVLDLWARPHYVSHRLDALPAPAATRWRDLGRLLIAWTASSPDDVERGRELADALVVEGEAAAVVAP